MKTLYSMYQFMVKHFTLLLALLLVLSVTGCSAANGVPAQDTIPIMTGEVYALQAGSVMRGIQQCILQAPGTQILMKGANIMFLWPIGDGYGFVAFNTTSRSALKTIGDIMEGGNFVNPKNMSDVVKFLAGYGWAKIGIEQIPEVVLQAVNTLEGWILSLTRIMPTFIVVPNIGVEMYMEQVVPGNMDS